MSAKRKSKYDEPISIHREGTEPAELLEEFLQVGKEEPSSDREEKQEEP